MIDRNHDLPVVRQCQILELARSTAYYTPKPTSPEDLALMRLGRWRHQLAQRLEHLLQLRPRILTEGLPPRQGRAAVNDLRSARRLPFRRARGGPR